MTSPDITFILGGARSGKSLRAEQLADASGLPVTYVATARIGDDEFAARVELHRERRPAHWALVESPMDLGGAIRELDREGQVLLVDCLTLWLANLLFPLNGPEPDGPPVDAFRAFETALAEAKSRVIVVSNEIGLGVVPMGSVTRLYIDELGRLNQRVAAISRHVTMMVAGLPLALKRLTMLFLTFYVTAMLSIAGVVVDRILGEPTGRHPLVAFGRYATRIETKMNTGFRARPAGIIAWFAAVAPPVFVSWILVRILPFGAACAVHVALLWFALGAKSLRDHIAPIARALGRGDLDEARTLTARIVSRDTSSADEAALSRAAVESALENGNDAIFGALFWFVIAGGPGALMFRLANTLDAMWGYKTPRFLRFGWAAARFDDVLNFVPARLTAASYALLGDTRTAWRCWRTQAPLWDSPNAGPVMASGAGSLNVMLGGAAIYHGTLESRPMLGFGMTAAPRHVVAAMRLVDRTLLLWLVVLLVCAFSGVGVNG